MAYISAHKYKKQKGSISQIKDVMVEHKVADIDGSFFLSNQL